MALYLRGGGWFGVETKFETNQQSDLMQPVNNTCTCFEVKFLIFNVITVKNGMISVKI